MSRLLFQVHIFESSSLVNIARLYFDFKELFLEKRFITQYKEDDIWSGQTWNYANIQS